MKATLKSSIYKALMEDHWLYVSYVNREGENTKYYLGIADIDTEKEKILCDIFNSYKDLECLPHKVSISIEGIQDAVVMEESFYPTSDELIETLSDTSSDLYKYLEVDTMDNNILQYLTQCYKNDEDPFLKDKALIDGVIPEAFKEDDVYQLDNSQFAEILEKVFKRYRNTNYFDVQESQQMGMNVLSINNYDKQFVVAYRPITLNFKNKTIKINRNISFNKSFLIEEKQITLSRYLDISPDDFIQQFPFNHRELIEDLKENLTRGELVNTDPSIFLLGRRNSSDVERAFNSIKEMEKEGTLTQPLKAFFGNIRTSKGSGKSPNIVVSDAKKINIDQMRVVYNSMVNHVTYVKGPPGTGKTETIFNVVLSAIANKKDVLICSNNNHPLNDIYEKLTKSFTWHNPKTNIEEPLMFPALRIYNNAETPKTLEAIKTYIKYAKEHDDIITSESIAEEYKNKSLSKNTSLKEALSTYEENVARAEDLDRLIKIKDMTSTEQLLKNIDKQIELKKEKIAEQKSITDEYVASLATSAKADDNFRNYLYLYFVWSYKRLLNSTYKELRDIVELYEIDVEGAVKKFNAYLRAPETLKRLLSVFPVIVCTNNSSDKLGPASPHFDLTIMDEAGQCNIASSLIPIVRGTDLLLVGDTNQLQPVTVIEDNLNEKFRGEFGVKKEYDYVDNSILSTMLSKDRVSKSLLLRYHYRCANKIATFPNRRYYNEQLKLLNSNPGSLMYVDVKNMLIPGQRNSYLNEAKEIVSIVKNGKYKDVGIVTPFVNQANLINEMLNKEGLHDVRAGTVHTLQGSERSTIILSSALSLKTARRTMQWIENNSELINVAVTRAKERLVFVGDKEAIDILSKGRNTDIKALSDYVASNGTIIPAQSEKIMINDFSNNSVSEKMFFDTVKPYFNRKGSKFRIERNVSVRETIRRLSDDEETLFGKKEFDIVISTNAGLINNRYSPIVVFEIDGGEHVGLKKTVLLDRQKEEICAKYGIRLIRISNNDVKDYEMIIQLFEQTAGLVEEQEMVQGSLFDIFEQEQKPSIKAESQQ